MKLLLPVVTPEDITALRQVDPDAEFYAGIELPEWYERFGPYEDLNRMSAFRKTANMSGLEAVCRLRAAAGASELYVTLNAACYSRAQRDFLQEVIAGLSQAQVTGVILGDPLMAADVRAHGLKAVASTMVGVYNADMARYCRDAGFTRLILPRDMTLQEIGTVIESVPDMEYECFLMRNGCRYSDSNCLARHSDRFGAICTCLDRSRTAFGGAANDSFSAHDDMAFNHQAFSRVFHKEACGVCAIWDLMQMGVTAGKVVGRADGLPSILRDAGLLHRNLQLSRRCASREEYLNRLEPPINYDSVCFQGCSCYYPEARYGAGKESP
ncbi:MAG: U32 family peptidase [Clostridia bacterium]|nr:U32 family peptidase [Clostridia bacterium]